jgi:DNA-binding transcriptional ArsR family regulator
MLDLFLRKKYHFFIMNTPDEAQPVVSTQPLLPLKSVLFAIGTPTRWQILSELSAGEPLMVSEIAQRTGRSADLVSKHLAVLRKCGMVVQSRGVFYQIPKQYLPVPGQRVADFGHCLLRLDAAG